MCVPLGKTRLHEFSQLYKPINDPYEVYIIITMGRSAKIWFGHNFWLEGPIDLRTMRLNYILQDLSRDTPLDHISSAQICNPNEIQILANNEPASLVFFRVASGWKAVEPYLWPFALEEKRREAKTKKPHFNPSPRQFVPKPVLSFGSLWNHLHFSPLIKFIAFLNRPPVWPIDVFFSHSETWRSQLNQININEWKISMFPFLSKM